MLSSSLNLISASDRIDDQAESSVPWSEKESKPVPRAIKRNFLPGKAEPKSEQQTSPTTNAKKRGRFEKNDFVKKIFIDYPCSRSDCRPERFDGKNVYFDDDDSSNDGGDYKRQAKERFRVLAFCKALFLIVYPRPTSEKKSEERDRVGSDGDEQPGVVHGGRRRRFEVLDDDHDDDEDDDVVTIPKAKRKRRDPKVSLLAPYVEELRAAKASQEASLKRINANLDPPHEQDMAKILSLRGQTAAALSTKDVLEPESLNKSSVPR